jgi:hypothetical protein
VFVANEEDALPPLAEGTIDALEQVRKGKMRNFMLICKGAKIRYLAAQKKPLKKKAVTEAKAQGYKGDAYFGVISGQGVELIFNLARADGYESAPTKDAILREFIGEHAELKCKPTFAILDLPPEIPFDEQEQQHPLIARFLKLEQAVAKSADAQPQHSATLRGRTAEVRGLLHEGEFDAAGLQIDELIRILKSLQTTSPPTNAEQPVAVDEAAMKQFVTRMKALKPAIDETSNTEDAHGQQIKQAVAQAAVLARKKDFVQANHALDRVEELLGAKSQQVNEAPAFNSRLKALRPAIEKAVAERGPVSQTIKVRVGEAVNLAKQLNFAAALQVLDEVERLIQPRTVGENVTSGSSQVDPSEKISLEKLQDARKQWEECRSHAIREIARLKDHLDKIYREHPEYNSALPAALKRLESVITSINEELGIQLDGVLNAPSAQRTDLVAPALKTLDHFTDFVASSDILAAIDGNEYLPDMAVAAPLRAALRSITSALV